LPFSDDGELDLRQALDHQPSATSLTHVSKREGGGREGERAGEREGERRRKGREEGRVSVNQELVNSHKEIVLVNL